MGFAVAVAGKGGTGKTTFAALLVRALREAGVRPVLAVDADPNSNLAEALGVEGGRLWPRPGRPAPAPRARLRGGSAGRGGSRTRSSAP